MEGRARGETCLYVALSETATELRGVATSHGWSLAGIEVFELARPDTLGPDEQYTLYHPSEIELGEMVKSVLEMVDRIRPSRVVLRLAIRDAPAGARSAAIPAADPRAQGVLLPAATAPC